ncbi:serine hydrolase domain-containing protein [Allokutzneria albata]|uniref:D-alanyl-D-alanine carboxypeptidase n=1 Tax=Allokutzneria albata TaxID=211114 RepID=A0A1G9V7F7_ALLAB|nr:serine hydrolase domain-containing protein [Allokutzneria albata]SDM68089.1 D-alanyl-D-alanine carboxypeptidase [Allokutzneria albata]
MTTIQEVLDRAVTEGGVPGILAEVHDGDRRWFGTAGVADTATGAPRLPEHRFRIGSTTKTFVATVLLQLVAEGRLCLDDAVERWVPGVGEWTSVRQLLNNTSGIFSYTDDHAALGQHEHYTPDMLVKIAMSRPADFAPGTSWGYSNTNYVLAGMVVERVTGARLAEEIAGRFGLPGTYLPEDEAIRGPHSRHYTKLYDPDPNAPIHDVTELDPSPFWAAGAMISTAGELNRFFGDLLGGRLLPPGLMREMTSTVPTKDWIDGTAYGLGLVELRLPSGVAVWGMAGAIFGSWTYTFGSRDGSHLVSANINGDWSDATGILDGLLEAEFSPTR